MIPRYQTGLSKKLRSTHLRGDAERKDQRYGTTDLKMISVDNEYICESEHRLMVFGFFVPSDFSQ